MEKKKLIQFRNIVKEFDGQIVLKGVNLDIYENEFVTLLGPSGCGKTTLLRILGGFLEATEGKVIFDGEDISLVPPHKRELNTVFQKYALFPHMTVYQNIAFGLKIKKVSKDVIEQKVMRMLKLIGLEGYENKNVTLLSGGQQQRVAIARALVNDPHILLADEPTGALDSDTSLQVMDLLKEVAKDRLVVMVTHNPELAQDYATRIVNLKDGKITSDSAPLILDESHLEKPSHQNMGKTSMSWFTSLALSFNNLKTKKEREKKRLKGDLSLPLPFLVSPYPFSFSLTFSLPPLIFIIYLG